MEMRGDDVTMPTMPTVLWSGSQDERAPLVVLLHGRGSNEVEIAPLASVMPPHVAVAALRGPVQLGPSQFTWFENRGIGRPRPSSLRASIDWFDEWLDTVGANRLVVTVGFSGGTAFAAGAVLDDPARFAGAALLYGTVPFDAGVPTTPERLAGVKVLHAQGVDDAVMPTDLMEATWSYLHERSGADLVAYRTTGGHAIAPEVMSALPGWLEGVLAR